MKKIILILFISFLTGAALAQDSKLSPAIMTNAFADSLTKQISRIVPSGYKIKLLYKTDLSAEGKFPKPLICREEADGTVADNDFVQKMRYLIMAAPAWKPALNGTTQVSCVARFFVIIDDGKINVFMDTKGLDQF